MEKPMYPIKHIRITQKHGEGTHKSCFAVDEAGIDGGISDVHAPFTGVIKKIYTADANEVWLESINKVEFPDGTKDYMTIMFCHDNSVTSLYVGKVINQGDIFYQEGTKGNATGNHLHFECAKGKFTGSGWYQDASGYWSIINGKLATDCLWIDDSYTIHDTRGYSFKKVQQKVGKPVARNEYVDQVNVFDTTTILRARKAPNGEVLGYMNSGIYNLLERKAEGDYEWLKVEENVWFANSGDWCEVLPKKEKPTEPPTEPLPTLEELSQKLHIELVEKEKELKIKDEEITILKENINELKDQNKLYTTENEQLLTENVELKKKNKEMEEHIKGEPTLVFTATRTDYYAIRLEEGQKLYLN